MKCKYLKECNNKANSIVKPINNKKYKVDFIPIYCCGKHAIKITEVLDVIDICWDSEKF